MKLQIIKRYIEEKETRDNWLDQLPADISSAFFDNAYVNSFGMFEEYLLKVYLGENLYNELMWYCYDMPAHEVTITMGEKDYKITSAESFYKYLTEVYFEGKNVQD